MSNELTAKTGNFDEIISIIDNARNRALKVVNAELIQMYWNVGEYLSELCAKEHFPSVNSIAKSAAQITSVICAFIQCGRCGTHSVLT